MAELSMTVEEYMKKYPLPEECAWHITPELWALMRAASEYIDEELPVPETPEGEEGSYLKYSSRECPKGDRSTPLKRARDRLYDEFMEEHAAEFGVPPVRRRFCVESAQISPEDSALYGAERTCKTRPQE